MVVDKICQPKANGLCLSFLFVFWVPIFAVLVYFTEGNPWAHLDQVANSTIVSTPPQKSSDTFESAEVDDEF